MRVESIARALISGVSIRLHGLVFLLGFAVLMGVSPPTSVAETATGLSAATLFSQDGIQNVSLSPTGRWVAAYAKSGRVDGILVREVGGEVSVPVVATEQTIVRMTWLGSDDLLLQTAGIGQETWLLVQLSMNGDEPRVEKHSFRTEGTFVDALPLEEGFLLWGFERDDRTAVHRISISELMLLKKNRNVRGRVERPGQRVGRVRGEDLDWIVDRSGRPRVALRRQDGEGYSIFYRGPGTGAFEEVYHFNDGDRKAEIWPQSLTQDETKLIVLADGGEDTRGLYEFDPKRRTLGRALFRLEERDLTGLRVDPYTREAIAVSYEEGGEPRFHYFDAYRKHYVAGLDSAFSAESTSILGGTADRQRFVFKVADVRNPGEFYLRDLASDRSARLGLVAADVDRSRLSRAESFVVESSDEVRVEAFLTLPQRASGAAPLVVMPHGGPFGVRDQRVFDPLVQYLASWGFAVLQPNYRGSSGYGRSHLEAGKKEWARGIEEDIEAAVQHATERPEVDGNRICIVGGSYGGFSALASVIRYPDRYRCAISANGVSDIPLLYDSSDIADSKRAMEIYQERVGDLESERDRLVDASPAYHADEINVPIFLIYGTADRRVDRDHAHRMMLMLDLFGKEYDSLEVREMEHSPRTLEWRIVARAIRRNLTKYLREGTPFVADPPNKKRGAFELVPRFEVDL